MTKIFEVKAKDGRLVRLTEKQWLHINFRHPEMQSLVAEIEKALIDPTAITQLSAEIAKFYKFIKDENKYIVVVVRVLNGDGFVVTSYKTKRIW